ncbi:COG4315 family predicted lipoprotein [Cellulomonas sp. McL0617]|uniref:COG4315 family predicted lipoprotein n=1 Tax=Cellulomonas sp. McL0617 TaxID=3415675 RepID=UPI003CEBC0E8
MRKTILLSITAVFAAGTLAACGSSSGGSSGGGGYGGGSSSTPSTAASAPAASAPAASAPAAAAGTTAADLSTANSSLGKIVVDGKGMTAYFFTKDTKDSGKSACTGDCAAAWPAIESMSATPTVDGVTGTVGTIPAADGGKQITIDGMPIYTFVKDMAAGDVNGQGYSGVWWVIAPDGSMMGG